MAAGVFVEEKRHTAEEPSPRRWVCSRRSRHGVGRVTLGAGGRSFLPGQTAEMVLRPNDWQGQGPGLVRGPCDGGRRSVVGKVLLHQEVGGVPAKRFTGRTWGSVQVAIPGPTCGSQGIFARLGGGQVRDRFPRAHSWCEQRVYADSLSRFYQPGVSRKIPEKLAGAERDVPPKKTQEWWETVEVGGDQEDSEVTAEQSSEEVGQRWRGAFADMTWDTKRGGPGHEVRVASHFVRLIGQVENSFCTWWAPDCKTFSKARGKPIPGAKSWPMDCRSVEFPLGLPILRVPRRKADRDKVEAGNEIASITFRLCSEAHKKGRRFAVENPRGSFMWDLPDARKLAAEVGVFKATFSLCMYEGGSRNKHVTVLTNSQALRARRQAVQKWQDLRSYWSRTRDTDTHGSQRRDPQLPHGSRRGVP